MTKLLTAISVLLVATASYAQTYTVDRVIDVNTIIIITPERERVKVKLIGIDTSESKPNNKAKRDSKSTGQEATEFIKEIFNFYSKQIVIEADIRERDRYNRILAYVFIETGFTKDEVINMPVPKDYHYMYRDNKEVVFLNASIIKAGYATPMTIPPYVKYADLFKELYGDAREQKRGLWANSFDGISSEQAIKSAIEFLKNHNLKWGIPTGTRRTVGITPNGNHWFAVEFEQEKSNGRFILVNPETAEAEFPKPR